MIRVGIVEDDKEIRGAVKEYLDDQPDFSCSLACESVELFINQLNEETLPDIILMDIGLPGMSGIKGTKLIKAKYPDINLIVFTVYHDSDKIFQSLCAGASGYLLKNAPFSEIKQAITIVHEGGASMSPQIARNVIDFFQGPKRKPDSVLTDKEREIVMGLVDGMSYQMIADQSYISIETVRSHIKSIYKKLQVHSKAELIKKSFEGSI
ncbi:MAG: response regulator transcription factor [Calditrichaceae bacterium]|nr:response regulator transcription factor [Calditrichaceae bacterium]